MVRIPLTRGQVNVWLAHQLLPDTSVLGVPFCLDVPARLDADALARAFQTLVNSADSLRTAIDDEGDEPAAVIQPRIDTRVELVEAEGDPDEFLERWLAARISRPFALRERLFDAAILRLGDHRTVWFLNQHHLITDGWSVRVLAGHLARLYSQAIRGTLPDSIDLPRYGDYVDHARMRESSEAYRVAHEFWQSALTVPVERPALYGRPSPPYVHHAARITYALEEWRSREIRLAAGRLPGGGGHARAEVAVFAAAMAVWQWRVSGVPAVSIGIPYHNRPAPFRDAPGLFANVIPLVIAIVPEESFGALLRRVHARLADALSHGDYPLAHSLHAPIYGSLVNYRRTEDVVLDGVPATPRMLSAGRLDGVVDLGVQARHAAHTLEFDLSREAFGPAARDRALQHFLMCLDGVLTQPDAPVSSVDVTLADERATLLSWGASEPVPLPGQYFDCILRHASERGDTPALIDGGTRVTYAAMADRARTLARHLRTLGVGPDVAVAIGLDRSADAVVAMLGVLAAGGGYVPLDLEWPDERISFVLADSAARAVLTSRAHRGRLHAIAPGVTPVAAEDVGDTAAPAGEPPPRTGEQLAYVIYTSGSTGHPKGVAVMDGSVSNHAHACVRTFGLTPGDRVLQFRRLVFDGSVEEIFPTLVAGATLVFRPRDAGTDFDALAAVVDTHAITVLELPTSYWHAWTRYLTETSGAVPGSVRLVAVGGEEPSVRALEEWSAITGGRVRWLNMYGPTETTVTATVFEAVSPVSDRVPMGRPLDNARVYVLDEAGRMVPIGVPGELYIGGAGVARGYVNQPVLTAERFVPDTIAGPPARLYRTGDRVRFRDDGVLEYLGRSDDQIKLRGYRIELTEIEHALERHPAVARAAALAVGTDAAARLLACIVEDSPVADAELRAHLRSLLPDYMVPGAFVRLERMPLTAGGKVDRRALGSIDLSSSGRAAHPDLRNPLEVEIAAIWERVLGLHGIGRADSYVELGGHSLLAARLVHEIGEALGQKLPLSVMFPDATVEKIAGVLQSTDAERLSLPIWSANLSGARVPFVYFHGDYSGGGFYATRLSHLLGREQPVVVVHPHGVDTADVPATIEQMARDRLPALLGVLRKGPVLLGGYCNGGLVAFETARLLGSRGFDVTGVVLLDATNDNSRFRRLARIVAWYAAQRGFPPEDARELALRWFNRQSTLAQLAGLDDVNPRFGSWTERLGFVTGAVRRKLRSRTAAGPVRPRRPARPSRHDVLFAAYARATAAYVAQPLDVPVVLIVSDDLPYDVTVAQWAPVVRRVTTFRLSGDHRAAVTSGLASVAGVVSEISNTAPSSLRAAMVPP